MAYINPIKAAVARFTTVRPPSHDAWIERKLEYELYDGYYHNTVYDRVRDGGFRDQINDALGVSPSAHIGGLYNPIARVIDLYRHTLSGIMGRDLTLNPNDSNMALMKPLQHIWRASNMNSFRQLLTRRTPLHGTSGIRIVSDPIKQRVYFQSEEASLIRDVDTDQRGYVIDLELEYGDTRRVGNTKETILIRERHTKERIQRWRIENDRPVETLYDKENGLGFVSYVLVPHIVSGTPFGFNAFYRVRSAVDAYNRLLSLENINIDDHLNGPLVIAASGKAPVEFVFDGRIVWYVDLSTGAQTPVFDRAVSDLDLGDSTQVGNIRRSALLSYTTHVTGIAEL